MFYKMSMKLRSITQQLQKMKTNEIPK